MVLKVFFPVDAVKCGKHCHHNLLRTDVTDLQYCFLSIEQWYAAVKIVNYITQHIRALVWFLSDKNSTVPVPYRTFVVCIWYIMFPKLFLLGVQWLYIYTRVLMCVLFVCNKDWVLLFNWLQSWQWIQCVVRLRSHFYTMWREATNTDSQCWIHWLMSFVSLFAFCDTSWTVYLRHCLTL